MTLSRARTPRALLAAVAALALAAPLSACASDNPDDTVILVTHDSFAVSKDVLAAFESESGLDVKVVKGGDAARAVNQAILTKDDPQGDVFFGVDNTLLSRALDSGVFDSYQAADLAKVPEKFQLDKAKHRVTPIDFGDVCVNYDREYFTGKNLAPPTSFADLAKPEYKNLLVVENPASSSPGLAFMLGSVAEFGEGGWTKYWQDLKANGLEVADSWEKAYYERFSGGSGKGDKPLVVSYASSPPAEVGDGNPAQAPTGVATGTCFRQIEFAGLLHNAKNSFGGKKLINFMLSKKFQEDVPLNMYVFPVRDDAALPATFTKYTTVPDAPKTLAPATIAKNRDQWLKTWKSTVL